MRLLGSEKVFNLYLKRGEKSVDDVNIIVEECPPDCKEEKPLGEYTLNEVKEHCNNNLCDKCDSKFRAFCLKILESDSGYVPAYWDLG